MNNGGKPEIAETTTKKKNLALLLSIKSGEKYPGRTDSIHFLELYMGDVYKVAARCTDKQKK